MRMRAGLRAWVAKTWNPLRAGGKVLGKPALGRTNTRRILRELQKAETMAVVSPTINATTVPESPSTGSTTVTIILATVIPSLVVVATAIILAVATICFCVRRRRVSITEHDRVLQQQQFLAFPKRVTDSVLSPRPSRSEYPASDGAAGISSDHPVPNDDKWSISAASGRSGISGLSETMSCPPSPVVSSLCLEEDDVAARTPGTQDHTPMNELQPQLDPRAIYLTGIEEDGEKSVGSFGNLPNLFDSAISTTHRGYPMLQFLSKTTITQNVNSEHRMHRQSSELHSDYYSDYNSRLTSEHHSSRCGGGTRTDRSDYYSEDQSGRHSLRHEHPKHPTLASQKTSSHEHPLIAPMIEFGSQNLYHNAALEMDKEEEVVDSIVQEAIMGYLVHQDSCSIFRCPCKKIKKRFHHLIPLAYRHMQNETQIDQENGQSRQLLQLPPHGTHKHKASTEQPDTHGASVSFQLQKPTRSQSPQCCQESHPRANVIPECLTQTTTLFRCSSKRMKFEDEANDFSLEIPEGAIPEGESLTIDIAVALHGQFQFPEGLRPVSPIFWVCVRDQPSIPFSKPMTVNIPHFLNLKNYNEIKSLGLTFLKADHEMNSEKMYEFHPTDGTMIFEPLKRCGVLKTAHFCSLCIACRDTPECLEKAPFCINAILPSAAIPVGKKVYGYFFITFLNLQTCLVKVDELVAKMPKAEHYERDMQPFEFQTETQCDPALEIAITQPKHGKIGLKGNRRVSLYTLRCYNRGLLLMSFFVGEE